MVQINLLPWRDQKRQQQKMQFFIALGGAVGITLALIVLMHFYLASHLSAQQARNDFLQTKITQLQTELAQLKKNEEEEMEVNKQLHAILNFQKQSMQAVELLATLTKIIPATISLNNLVFEGNTVALQGVAKSDLEITHLMKTMSDSALFTHPVLTSISAKKNAEMNERLFVLNVTLRGQE